MGPLAAGCRMMNGTGPSSGGYRLNMMEDVTTNLRVHRTEAFVLALVFFVAIGSLGASPAQAQSIADRAFLAWAVQIEIQQQDMGRMPNGARRMIRFAI